MQYLFYGSEELLIKKEVEKVLKKFKIDEMNKVEYDLETTSLKTIIEDALTVSLFGDKKAIVVFNSYIFTPITPKGVVEQDLTILLEYLSIENPDTILIFTTLSPKLDERKKITKTIKKVGTVLEFNEKKDLTATVKAMFEPYSISSPLVSLFIERVGKNLYIIEQEIEKIKTYKNTDMEITKENILDLTTKNIDMDIFNLIDCIILNQKKQALEIYHEMMKQNEEPIKVIILLANQFRLLYQAKELAKQGYQASDIASELGIHPYRVKLALEKARKYSSKVLLSLLSQLADMDYQIKSGKLEKNAALELFILEI